MLIFCQRRIVVDVWCNTKIRTRNDMVTKRVVYISIQMFRWIYICFRVIHCIHDNDGNKTAERKMLKGFFINTAKPVHLSCVHSSCFDLAILRNDKLYLKYHDIYFTCFTYTDINGTNWYTPSTNLHKTYALYPVEFNMNW
jgi:hypothetical protein